MKRLNGFLVLLFVLAAVLVLPVSGMAESEAPGKLTLSELTEWTEGILKQARQAKPIYSGAHAEQAEGGYELVYEFATLYLDTPALTDASVVHAIVINEVGVPGPRGVEIYDTQQMVLSAYANENPDLEGDRDFAALYLSNNMPDQALWGWVQRDGQMIQAVQYAVHSYVPEKDGYTDCGVVYSLEDDTVFAIRIYGLAAVSSQQEVEENIREVMAVQEESFYFAYPQSAIGTDLNPFLREDLLFSEMDFLTLSPEMAISILGPIETESWFQDDTGVWLRVMQWPVAEITFVYSKDKVFERVDTLAITQRGLEGPRAVQVDDSLASVMMRFRHGEAEYDGTSREVLYGDGQTPPFGLAEYEDITVTLHYECPVAGVEGIDRVALHMIFVDAALAEVLIYSW